MTPPVLSVIIPTYNRAAFLACAVDSVLAQTGVEVEVIVVDDGSTDSTAAVLERRAARWGQRVRYLRQDHAERGVARNRGLREARGAFVASLDSDDLWRPDHARRCLTVLARNPRAVAAYGDYGQIDQDGRVIRERVVWPLGQGRDFLRDLCLKRLILHPSRVVMRRAALDTDPFDPECPGVEDWRLWLLLADRGVFEPVGNVTVWMRVHAHGTFSHPQQFTHNLMLAAQRIIATGLPAHVGIPGPRILAINRCHCAYVYYLAGQWSEAGRWLAAAIRHYPPVVKEVDFWQVLARLLLGRSLSKRIRAVRQQGRGAIIPLAQPMMEP